MASADKEESQTAEPIHPELIPLAQIPASSGEVTPSSTKGKTPSEDADTPNDLPEVVNLSVSLPPKGDAKRNRHTRGGGQRLKLAGHC